MGRATQVMTMKQDIVKADFVDAVVNAANRTLLGGGGVDGAIHKAAGCSLFWACLKLHGCAVGSAKITKAYGLPCKYIIHTVGPRWHGGKKGEAEVLYHCYYNSLILANEYGIRTIAFPSISTGIFSYPLEQAADVAVTAVYHYVKQNPEHFDRIIWVFLEEEIEQAYQRKIRELFG